MNKVCAQLLVVMVALCFAAGPALANGVRLINKDATAYKLYVKHRGSAVHTSIRARSVSNICSRDCSIRLKGTGMTVNARAGDKIVIKNGRFTRNR